MSKKLNGNGLWESSRMMLPQHKVAIIEDQLRHSYVTQPDLDEQEVEQIEGVLARSFRESRFVTLKLFGDRKVIELQGVVTVVQTYRREIKLAMGIGEWQWVQIKDIISAE
ncbi:YolD-like family protein [Paenibacillus glacialis]|uniref:YolD-like family protein n=1 Tax=Paenibacillus glacialis TaxID=494026 RepID=A0A168DDL2_9BACL|nr:YolD-like family protein [Paenibacillus glacialis]OAB34101.1 hypothetical protein PGLA_24705 [Paenibacillus glacialis]